MKELLGNYFVDIMFVTVMGEKECVVVILNILVMRVDVVVHMFAIVTCVVKIKVTIVVNVIRNVDVTKIVLPQVVIVKVIASVFVVACQNKAKKEELTK
jgi:uncharacterized membrane protein YdjX (TVP38/TMEM64 family)